MWFKGTTTADRFDKTANVISSGNGGPFPRFVDINGDGKLNARDVTALMKAIITKK